MSDKENKRKVFAVNFSGRDYQYADAEKLGEIIYMTKGVLDLSKCKYYSDIIKGHLEKNSSYEDYLLFSGPHIISSIALSHWMRLHSECNVLLWDGVKKQYDLYHLAF